MKVLVFAFHGLQMIQRFFVGVLELEQLSAEGTRLFLRTFQLRLRLLVLLLPLSQDLRELHITNVLNKPSFPPRKDSAYLQWVITLSKFLCFLSKAAAAALDLSTSTMRSSISP